MQKHLRCESVDSDGHRCNKKTGHDELKGRKKKGAVVEDDSVRRHGAYGKSW